MYIGYHRQDVKELKVRPGTDVHDYEVRLRAAQKFLAKVSSSKLIKSGISHMLMTCSFASRSCKCKPCHLKHRLRWCTSTAHVHMHKLAARQAATGTYLTYNN